MAGGDDRIKETMIKLGGVTLLFIGFGLLGIGFLTGNKFMQATGFMSGIIAFALLYYIWARAGSRIEEEPE